LYPVRNTVAEEMAGDRETIIITSGVEFRQTVRKD
jgi:hypothetical protein